MTTQEGKPWCEIADDMVRLTHEQKQKAIERLSDLAPSGTQKAIVAESFSNRAREAYLRIHYLETVESNPATPSDLVSKLSALRTQIGESPDWAQKAKVFRQFVESETPLMKGYSEYDFSTVKAQLADKFGHLFPEFNLPKLSVAIPVVSTAVHVITGYREALQLAEPFVKSHELSEQAGADYADVFTKAKLMQSLSNDLEPGIGYHLFKTWADQYHVPESIRKVLDPTDVSRTVQNFAPEA